MRSVLLILGSIAVIAVVAGLYVWMQPTVIVPATPMQVAAATAPAPLPAPPTAATAPGTQPVIGEGHNVWVQVPDEKDPDRLAWRFRSDQHIPRPDGSVDVTSPEAEFFLDDGKVMSIVGSRGRVIIPGEAAKDPSFQAPNELPSRGELHDVVLTLYPDNTRGEAIFRCTVDNLAFDNDALRIQTEAIQQSNGVVIPADQAPVQVRGVEYDFDGKGLIIRWNGRDRRLQSLEIAHGDTMTYKPTTRPATTIRPSALPPATRQARAQTVPPRRGGAAPASAPATRSAEQPVYQATFSDNVVVTRADTKVVVADEMTVALGPQEEQAKTEAKPTTGRSEPAKNTQAASPTTRKSRQLLQGPLGPATGPSDEPYVIKWTGKLTLVPVLDGAIALKPGGYSVALKSRQTPVEVNFESNSFSAASLNFNSSAQTFVAVNSEFVPQVHVRHVDGTEIVTQSIRVNGNDGIATLDGPSTARFMIDGDQPGTRQPLNAKWDESCVLKLVGATTNDPTLESARIRGGVHIDHPKLGLESNELDVHFAPPPADSKDASLQLSSLEARGGVKATVQDNPENPQQLTADTLTLSSVNRDGVLVPHIVHAEGQVHSFDRDKEVRAGDVTVTLGPSTRPNGPPVLEELQAFRDVVFKQGQSSGTASNLDLKFDGEDVNLTMTGSDARVTANGSTLTGPIIKVATKQQEIQVVGPGTLKGAKPAEAGATPMNVDLAWGVADGPGGLDLNGVTNKAVLTGGVRINAVTPDRVTMEATADSMLVDLADPPATQPATQPAKGVDLMAKKQLRSITLDGDARINAVVADAAGQPVKRMYLQSSKVGFEPDDKNEISRMVVPVAGKMLYEDLSPTTRPAELGTADIGDFRGPTAFQWSDKLSLDQKSGQAAMSGDVNIVHQTDTGEPFSLQTQNVVASFAPSTPANAAPTTRAMQPDLQRLVADGGVQFNSRRISFAAQRMDFDPANTRLSAYGAEGSPVQIFDGNGVTTGSLREAFWNTQTQDFEVKDLLIQIRR